MTDEDEKFMRELRATFEPGPLGDTKFAEELEKACRQLEAKGLIKDTCKRRDGGRIVWGAACENPPIDFVAKRTKRHGERHDV
jgi:hypothetical protein